MEKPPVLSDEEIIEVENKRMKKLRWPLVSKVSPSEKEITKAQRDADFRWFVEQLKKMGKETLDNGLHIDHWIPAEQWKALKEEVKHG